MSELLPFLIAHRGASEEFVENTRPAVQRALELGCTAIECDVQFTRDGLPVVFHDADLQRLAGTPERIRDLPADQVVGRPVRTAGRPTHGALVPSLEQWLSWIPADVLAVVEVKPQEDKPTELDLLGTVADRLREHSGKSALISFSTRIAKAGHKLLGDLPHGPVRSRPLRGTAPQLMARHARPLIVLNQRLLEAGTVQQFREEGKEVWSYALDDTRAVERAVQLGVRGIITNRPAAVREVVPTSQRD